MTSIGAPVVLLKRFHWTLRTPEKMIASLRHRVATHEAGHAVACLSFGIDIISVTIDAATPHLLRACYRERADLALEAMVTVCLAGPAAESAYAGTITDDSDLLDIAMARDYLARRLHPAQIGTALTRLRTAADRLVQTPWARDRIQLIAAALLKRGSLSGAEINELS